MTLNKEERDMDWFDIKEEDIIPFVVPAEKFITEIENLIHNS